MKLEKFVWTVVAAGVALLIGTAPLDATAAQGPKPKPTVKTTPAPKTTTTLKVKTTSAPKPKTTSQPKVKKSAPAPRLKNAKSTTKVKSSKPAKSTTTTSTTSTSTTTTTSTSTSGSDGTTTTTVEPLSKAQLHLMKNPKMQTKMQQRLGLADTQAVIAAASGFKNLGQFVAAVNVSNNHGIAFNDLKLAMTGIDATGVRVSDTTMSLGQAIQSLKNVDSTTATTTANTALTQANTEIQTTTVTTTTTTSTTTSKSKSKKNNGNH